MADGSSRVQCLAKVNVFQTKIGRYQRLVAWGNGNAGAVVANANDVLCCSGKRSDVAN
jgi:hypothetical protein